MSANNPLRTVDHLHPGRSPQEASGAQVIDRMLEERQATLNHCLDELRKQSSAIAALSTQIVSTLRQGRKMLVAGNGGSAAESQHFVAELVGRFRLDRAPYAAIALTTDTSILTAIANDYGYDEVFARQVGALGNAGDMLVVISTSGTSSNLLRAIQAAREQGLYVVALTGNRRNQLADAADCPLQVPNAETASVQELQGILLHLLCDTVESELAANA